MSKLNHDLVVQAVEDLLKFSKGETIEKNGEQLKGKKRNFTETVELQVSNGTKGGGEVWFVGGRGWWCCLLVVGVVFLSLMSGGWW